MILKNKLRLRESCNKFVILYHFAKKTQKTPRREIEKALTKLKDFLERSDKK